MYDLLIGSSLLFILTTIGVSFIFLKDRGIFSRSHLMLSVSGGIMLASSFLSLLLPSIEISKQLNYVQWIPPVIGFITGIIFIHVLDKILPHIHFIGSSTTLEGVSSNLHGAWLLFFAMFIHNIPEGLAVGIAYASENIFHEGSPFSLALGIGIQDIPEGFATAIPLVALGYDKKKAFFWGCLSGIIEFFSSLFGFALIQHVSYLLPFALSFAAGAMIYVVVEEIIPQAQKGQHNDHVTLFLLGGFIVMMILDLSL
ncbi:MAG: ZIP family metal transporter [Bacteroidales bacterium]|nr:ZIP family metal transporter [Bacteroidales bacterium]